MDSDTHRHMIESAERHIESLKVEVEEYRSKLPQSKYKLRAAQEHLAEHQKELQMLKKAKPENPPAFAVASIIGEALLSTE